MNNEFIESIVNIIKKEQIEKYQNKNSILNILCFDYDNFENFEIENKTESSIYYFLTSDTLLYRYIGDKSIIQKEDIKRVFYMSFC